MRRFFAHAGLLLLLPTLSLAQTVPPGFTDAQVVPAGGAQGALSPTAVAYEPGAGHLWMTEKGNGMSPSSPRVRRKDAGTGLVNTALTLTVDSRGERGILGLAFDPNFLAAGGAERFVYIYYTTPNPAPHNRVSRFIESAGVLALASEQILLEGPDLNAATNHNGGCLRFRADGTLYISMGDNDTDADANPRSRDMSDLRGKILRINRDGSIPADNPFVGQPGVREEIYEFGMRNPWRFHVDAETDALWIGDVGENCFENVFVGLAGADHGYPCFEGVNPFRACSGTLPPGSVTFPVYWYGHGQAGCSTPPVSGNSITGGPVYRATAFPAEYRGNYFFADYGSSWIRRARIAPDNTLVDVEMFDDGASGAVDLAVSPSGCLTYASVNAGVGVHDVCYVGGANSAPQAVASAVPMAGLSPLDVQFTGSLSSDPDLDTLSFSWAFGDAGTDVIADPLHQYSADGVYSAVLTVDDGRAAPNSSDQAPPLRIVVGNRPPIPRIAAPANGSLYNAGDTIVYAGDATDPEDGLLPATSLEWTVVFHHDLHQHPFLGPIQDVSGGQFVVPRTGEDSTSVFYRIWLSAADSGAPVGSNAILEASTSIDIVPNVTTTTLATLPPVPGLQLGWEGTFSNAPSDHLSIGGFQRRIIAPLSQTLGPDTWDFVSWSDAGVADHGIFAPTSDATITATYRCASGPGCSETGLCADAVDNDFDGQMDCADIDCAGDPACLEQNNCGDGVDNDLDTFVDCLDSDCVGTIACTEIGFCQDGLDNDGDGPTDCADSDCAAEPSCMEAGNCSDTVDNDLDAAFDCADPDCAADVSCIEAGNCLDGRDNDRDSLTDCADSECAAEVQCIESGNCNDRIDNDVDSLTDCFDADCSADPICGEVGNCNDSVDNDLDFFTDCFDSDCIADPTCAGQDFDQDGAPNASDCAPTDGSAFAIPPEIARLDVVKAGAMARLSWTDHLAASGLGGMHDIASGLVSTLAIGTGANAPCTQLNVVGLTFDDPATVTNDALYWLVRIGNACGEGPWGNDSRGSARPTCP